MARKAKKAADPEAKIRAAEEAADHVPAITPPDYDTALDTGSTLLNLAITGRPHGGWVRGFYYFFAGGTDSGKSFFLTTALAEAANDPRYDGYQLIADMPEDGVQMDLAAKFGSKLASRLRAPCYTEGQPDSSRTAEEFYVNLEAACKRGPCVYVLDSMDALSSGAEGKHFDKVKTAVNKARKGKDFEAPGSWGDGKARVNASGLRLATLWLGKTKSILLMVLQEKVDLSPSWETKNTSGGKAPSYYAQSRVWASRGAKIVKEKTINKKKRYYHVGYDNRYHIERSRFTGRGAVVEVPIHTDSGIDDVGSCIDYLLAEGHWKASECVINAHDDLGIVGKHETVIEAIETRNLEPKLREIVSQVWHQRLKDVAVLRKPKYT
jgi:hypothetical protein